MKSVLKKLNKIQVKLKAPKGQFNKFGKYKYRNAEDILEAVKPHLGSELATLIVRDEIVKVEDRFYVKAKATLYCSETGEDISSEAYARESLNKKGMDDSQITGATSSYARKYAMNGLFAIDDNKDADSDDNTNAPKKVEKKSTKSNTKKIDTSSETKNKTALKLEKFINVLNDENIRDKAIQQAISQRFITQSQKEELLEFLEEKYVNKIEVR